jgi:signal transduction histidine kinase
MLLEDVTEPVARAAKTRQTRRLDMLSQVIGRIAHNIRTPLTAIKTYAELMEATGAGEGLETFWQETVSPELERLEQLIGELVQVVEQPEPQYQPVQLARVVEQAIDEIFTDNEHDAAPPDFRVAPGIPEIVADPAPTRDAIGYLMRYLRGAGGSRIKVAIDLEEAEEGETVALSISASVGAGATDGEQVLDPIFALQQPDGDLGPAISRQLMERQGGTLQAIQTNGSLKFQLNFPVTVTEPLGSRTT